MKYKAIIFDFDGTVMDGSGCIMTALAETCAHLGYDMPKKESLTDFIGPPIWTSMKNAGFSDGQIPEMLTHYREFCRKPEAMRQFRFFDGIAEMLEKLKEKGYRLAIVSMRTQGSLEDVDAYHGYAKYFDIVYGRQGDKDSEVKSELLLRVLDMMKLTPAECLLVGDSKYDEEGALATGMDFAAVTYGFGYRSEKDVESCIKVCGTVEELTEYLMEI